MSAGAQQPAGWYYAQGDPPGTVRYWDGTMWVGGPQPSAPATAAGAPAASGVAFQGPSGPRELTNPWARLGGRILDGMIWALLGFIANLPVTASTFGETFNAALEGREPDIDVNPVLALITTLVGVLAVVAYEVLLNTRGGTLGKRAISAIVVTEDGEQVDNRAALMRMVPYIVIAVLGAIASALVEPTTGNSVLIGTPFWLVALAGLIMLFADSKRQTPWDKAGRTLVVNR